MRHNIVQRFKNRKIWNLSRFMKNDFNFQRRNHFWSNSFYFRKISNQTDFFSKQHFCQQFFFFLDNSSFMRICRKRFDVRRVLRFISKNRKIRYFLYLSIESYEYCVFSFFIIFFFSWRFFQKKNRSTFLNSRIEFFYFFVYMSCIFSIRDLFVLMLLKHSSRFF